MRKFIWMENDTIVSESNLYVCYLNVKREMPLDIWFSFTDFIKEYEKDGVIKQIA